MQKYLDQIAKCESTSSLKALVFFFLKNDRELSALEYSLIASEIVNRAGQLEHANR